MKTSYIPSLKGSKTSDIDPRIDLILSMIMELAAGNFAFRITPSNRDDEVDAVMVGLNMLGEELEENIKQQKALHNQLVQSEKMAAIGQLAHGVAHEINTPIQFVSDSIHFIGDAIKDLAGLIERYRALHRSLGNGMPFPRAAPEISRAEEEADLDYLSVNLPPAVERSLDGLYRVANIVRSMKEFAHPDQKEMSGIDLNKAIQNTLTIARNEYKYVADVQTDFGELPSVICCAGEINQSLLNIIVNAAQAINDVAKKFGTRGLITVRTRQDNDSVVIFISDTGGGIPQEIRDRIYDPFFTTKEVGKGTGQGLAIARSVIVDKHHGELKFETEIGKGTTFFIRLPVDGAMHGCG